MAKSRQPRHAFDHYQTPAAHIDMALDLVSGTPATILDPGAGDGAWGTAARQRWPVARIIGVEVRDVPCPPGYDEWHTGPFEVLAPALPGVDLVVGNPPYRVAEQFVRRSLALLNEGGQLVFLLRLAFLESRVRTRGLFREQPPALVSVCAARPIFYGDGRNGADAFAFFVWRRDFRGRPGLSWSDRPADASGQLVLSDR